MTEVLNHESPTEHDSNAQHVQPLKAVRVLQPFGNTPHFQHHASLRFDGMDLSVYSRLANGDRFNEAYLCFSVSSVEGGFRLGMDLTNLQTENIIHGLQDAMLKVRQIHSLDSASEVVEVDDWLHYEQTTGDLVKAKTGGVSYRVFANQLDHMSAPEVMLMTYCHHGFTAGSKANTGFITPDAADELADALKAAAYRARMMAAEQKAQGGDA